MNFFKIAYSSIIFLPFLYAFSYNFDLNLSSLVNIILLIFFFSFFFFLPTSYSKKNITISLIFVCATILNYLITDFASLKWLLNWFGFIIIFFLIYHLSYCLNKKNLIVINNHAMHILKILIIFFVLVILSGLFFFKPTYWYYLKGYFWNSFMLLYAENYSFSKVYVAVVIILFATFIYFNKKKINFFLYLAAFASIFFIWFGIRSLFLGSFLFLLTLFLIKSKFRFLIAFSSFFIIFFIDDFLILIEPYFDRAPSYRAAFYILSNNIFGIGNGGYTPYIYENFEFFTNNFRFPGFWPAAESDFVYYIASWGILSIFFILMSSYIVLLTSFLLVHKSHLLTQVDKVILSTTSIVILMGISQDYYGQIFWFVYIALSLGTIERVLNIINKVENHNKFK